MKLIGDKQFYKSVLRIAVPIMIQNGVTNMIGLANNITVGQLGTEQLAGVAIANQLISIFYLCVFGAVSGAGIFGAQFFGKRDYNGVRDVFRLKVILMVALSVLGMIILGVFGKPLISSFLHDASDGSDLALTLKEGYDYLLIMLAGFIPYGLGQAYGSTLREADQTIVPMRASIIALLLSLALNYVLIPFMGVAGAATATVAQCPLGKEASRRGPLLCGCIQVFQSAGHPQQTDHRKGYSLAYQRDAVVYWYDHGQPDLLLPRRSSGSGCQYCDHRCQSGQCYVYLHG